MACDLAVILAGGKGIRMRRLGEYLPKCALVIYDQPLIVRQIEISRKAGCQHVLISVNHHFAPLIESLVRPVANTIQIELSVDERQRGPASALLDLQGRIDHRNFFLFLGDIYVQSEAFWGNVAQRCPEHLVIQAQVADCQKLCAGCNVVIKQGQVVCLQEKPLPQNIIGDMCWTGITYVPKGFFHFVQKGRTVVHLGDLYQQVLENGLEIEALTERDPVINLTTPDDLLLANACEFRRVCAIRPDEKKATLEKLKELYGV